MSRAQAQPATSPSTVTQEVELVYWKDIKDSTDPEEFQAFLGKFPAGIYADLAQLCHAADVQQRRPGANQGAELTAEYLVDTKAWAVGSPATVADLIREQFELAGGFGTLLMLGSDYADPAEREKWFRSMELLSTEVMPRLRDLPVRPS